MRGIRIRIFSITVLTEAGLHIVRNAPSPIKTKNPKMVRRGLWENTLETPITIRVINGSSTFDWANATVMRGNMNVTRIIIIKILVKRRIAG